MRQHRLASWALAALLLVGSAPGLAGANGAAPRRAKSPWGASYFPNVPLTTHEGETVHFFDDVIEDKVVVINFIFTSCQESCPLETAQMARVYHILGERVGKDVFMYSITIDPDHDTPEVLASYAKKFNAGPGWTFLTGRESDIILLRRKLGLYIESIQSEDSDDHNLNMVIGNQATGRWMKRSPFENAYVLASTIGGELHNWKQPRAAANEYGDAPKLRNISKGESLFRTRCSACHTVGGGDVARDARRVGPDLLGVVERRERTWLVRWLAEPDKMLEEKDPIALQLYEAYDQVPMPNSRLNEFEVDILIGYLADESRRLEKAKPDSAPKAEVHAQHEHHRHH